MRPLPPLALLPLLLIAGCQQRDLQLDAEREQLRRELESHEAQVAADFRKCWTLEDAADAAEKKAEASKPEAPPKADPSGPDFNARLAATTIFYESDAYRQYEKLSNDHMALLEQWISCRKALTVGLKKSFATRNRVSAIDSVQKPNGPLIAARPSEFADDEKRSRERAEHIDGPTTPTKTP